MRQDDHHPQLPAIHGLRLQKVPYTKYVFANAEFVIPHPNDGKVFDLQDENSYTMYNVIDAEKMEVAFQIIVDGNLDNTDADYTGRFTAATCYNSEKAYDLGMMRNERDWVVVFDIEAAEKAVKAGKFITLGDSKVPVLDGRKKGDKDSEFTRYIPVPKNPHGCNTSSDGKYFIANGKLSPTVTMIEIAKLPDLFAGKLKDPRHRGWNWASARCTPPSTVAATPTPRCSSTAGGEVEHGRRGTRLQGREGRVHQAEARCALPAGPHSCLALRNQRSRRQVAGGAVQVLQGPLPAHRAAAPRTTS